MSFLSRNLATYGATFPILKVLSQSLLCRWNDTGELWSELPSARNFANLTGRNSLHVLVLSLLLPAGQCLYSSDTPCPTWCIKMSCRPVQTDLEFWPRQAFLTGVLQNFARTDTPLTITVLWAWPFALYCNQKTTSTAKQDQDCLVKVWQIMNPLRTRLPLTAVFGTSRQLATVFDLQSSFIRVHKVSIVPCQSSNISNDLKFNLDLRLEVLKAAFKPEEYPQKAT